MRAGVGGSNSNNLSRKWDILRITFSILPPGGSKISSHRLYQQIMISQKNMMTAMWHLICKWYKQNTFNCLSYFDGYRFHVVNRLIK